MSVSTSTSTQISTPISGHVYPPMSAAEVATPSFPISFDRLDSVKGAQFGSSVCCAQRCRVPLQLPNNRSELPKLPFIPGR